MKKILKEIEYNEIVLLMEFININESINEINLVIVLMVVKTERYRVGFKIYSILERNV